MYSTAYICWVERGCWPAIPDVSMPRSLDPRMHRGGAVVAFFVVLVACLALIAWKVLPGASAGPVRLPEANAPPVALVGSEGRGEPVPPPREVARSPGAVVRVASAGGRPLSNSYLLPEGVGGGTRLDAEAAISMSDSLGEMFVSEAGLATLGALVVWCEGYVPYRVGTLESGDAIEVVLQPGYYLDLHVQSSDGFGVPGFAAAVAPADVSPGDGLDVSGRLSIFQQFEGGHSVGAMGVTDSQGDVSLGPLSAGRHFVRLNLTSMPVAIQNWQDAIVVDVPGECEIRVEDLWGVVADFDPNDVLLASLDRSGDFPFAACGERVNVAAISATYRRMEEAHPQAFVAVGRLSVGAPGLVTVRAFSRSSGWTFGHVRLSPLRQGVKKQVLQLPQQEVVPTSELVVELEGAGEARVGSGAQVRLSWLRDGSVFAKEAPVGERVEVPPGAIQVMPGKNMPPDLFAPLEARLIGGEEATLMAHAEYPLRKLGIRVKMPTGRYPSQCGVAIRWNDPPGASRNEGGPVVMRRSTSSVNIDGGALDFFSGADQVEVSVFVQGYQPVRGILRSGEGVVLDACETFVFLPQARSAQ